MTLAARNLSYRAGSAELLRGVSLEITPGSVHALLGPNGAGKSTLLRLLARELAPAQGEVLLEQLDLKRWTAQDLARRRAVLPQGESLRFGFTVTQVVELGRLPCARHDARREAQIVDEALQLTDAAHLAGRIYPTLSGGERQRVQLARVLAQIWEKPAQGARYLLLDEPTAGLDLKHQHDCLRVARRFAAEGTAVIVVLHDPNLALHYADSATLLSDGAAVAQGSPADVLSVDNLRRIYGVDAEVLERGARRYIALR